MRKMVMLAVLLALCAASVSAGTGAMITASVLRYEPTPAEQGNTVDVWVQLSNEGTKADRVAVKFIPKYPFSLPAGQKGEVDVGTVSATENQVVKFTLFVDPNAPNGDRNATFQYKYGSVNDWIQLEAPISLQTKNAVLIIDDYEVSPSPVVPGQTVEVTLKVRNAGRIAVKNLDVSIDLPDGSFNAIGTGAKQRVDRIDAGETETVTFTLVSDTSTLVKVYSIPVTLAYQDERNTAYADTAKVSLVVNSKPELALTVDSTDFASKTKPGTVSLKIVNKGVVNLKYVTVKLVQTEDYDVLSPSGEEYVGNLDSDDFETVDFLIKPLVASPRLHVQLEFKDPYNVDFTQGYDLPLRILTDKDLGKGGSPIGMILFVLVVAGGAGYWWFRRKKKR